MAMTLLQNLIKYARVVMGGKDDKTYPIQQVEYYGKAGNVFIVFPYGMHANLPEDSLLSIFAANGNEQDRFGIGGLPNERIKNLPVGEVVFFHPITKSKVHFKNNGDVDVDTTKKNGNVNINCGTGNVVVNCKDVDVNCDNAIVNASEKIDYTAPEINLNGIVNISGMLNALGGLDIPTETITVQGIDLGPSHNHADGTYKTVDNIDVVGISGSVNP
jgi:phage gp45-like